MRGFIDTMIKPKKLLKIAASAMIMLGLLAITLSLKDVVFHGNHHLLPGQILPLPGVGQGATSLSGKEFAERLGITPKTGEGFSVLKALIFDTGYKRLKELIGIIAVVAMTYMGIQMIINNGNEERITKARQSILIIFIGLAIIAIADSMVKGVFLMTGGTFLNLVTDEQGQSMLGASQAAFNERIGVITTFIRYIVQGFAFFFVVRSGLALIVAGQESEVLDRQKKIFTWGLIGFVFIMVAETVIKDVVFPAQYGKSIIPGQEQIQTGVSLISQITNVVLAFAAGVAVFSIIAAAVLYALPGGQDTSDRAKKIIIGALTGLVIIYSAYTVVAEFIK